MPPPDAMVPASQAPPPPPPPPAAPAIRGRPRKRAESVETVRYPSEPAQAKARAKARATSASTVRYPSQEPVLPTEEEAEKTEVMLAKVKKKIIKLKASGLAAQVGKEAKDDKPKPVAKAKGRPRKIPSAGPQGAKTPVIRKVRIASGPPEAMGVLKRGRGRPKGAVGKAKRDLAAAVM